MMTLGEGRNQDLPFILQWRNGENNNVTFDVLENK